MFDRDEQEISQIIETGLKAVRSGKTTLEQFLAQYPDQADEIRPEIAAALYLIASQRLVESRPGFVTASRKRVLDRIKTEAREQGHNRSFFGIVWPRQIAIQWMVAAMLLLVVLTGAGGVVSFSQAALPGDNLYAVKRASEQVAYTVTLDDVQRVQLSATYAERRLEEVQILTVKGSFEQAGKALQEYKQQVAQTVALLQNVSDSQPMSKLAAAVSLRTQLSKQSKSLGTLMASAPADLRVSLQDAQGAITAAGSATTDVIKGIPEATLTKFPTVFGTELVIETPTPESTREPSVEPPVGSTDEPNDLSTPNPDADETPGVTTTQDFSPQSVGTPVPTQKPSKTARPDTKDPKNLPSPAVNSGNSGNNNSSGGNSGGNSGNSGDSGGNNGNNGKGNDKNDK